MPWLIYEPNFDRDESYWTYTHQFLADLNINEIPKGFMQIIIPAPASYKDYIKAKIILTRNPNFGIYGASADVRVPIPHKSSLHPNKRFVLLVDGEYAVGQLKSYRNLLTEYGYDPNQLVQRETHLPPLSYPFPDRNPNGVWQFDFTQSE